MTEDLPRLRLLALAPAASERLIEAAGLAGSLVLLDDALRCGLVVGFLGLVPDLLRPLVIASINSPVEALGEISETGADGLVLLVLFAALLVALGGCGHPLTPL